jgi:class 3 adenylate cyclase
MERNHGGDEIECTLLFADVRGSIIALGDAVNTTARLASAAGSG